MMRRYFSTIFSLDLRSLALMRVGVSLVLLADLGMRFFEIEAHYSDQGIFPSHALQALSTLGSNLAYSPLGIVGEVGHLQILFGLAMASALGLLLGFFTPFFSILCFFFITSIHSRNPFVCIGGDALLRNILAIGIFLPWGSYFSLDSRRRLPPDPKYLSGGTAALVLQLLVLYFLTGLEKTGVPWTEGTAVGFVLKLGSLIKPTADLFPLSNLQSWYLTHAVRFSEIFLPLLLLVPWRVPLFRGLFFVVIAVLHVGFGFFLELGIFPFVSVIAMLGLLPPSLWTSQMQVGSLAPFYPKMGWIIKVLPYYLLVSSSSAYFRDVPTIRPLYLFSTALGLSQKWTMFAPSPPVVDSQFRVLQGPVPTVYGLFPSTEDGLLSHRTGQVRWHKYFSNLSMGETLDWTHLGRFLCKELNQHSRVDSLTVEARTRTIHPPGFSYGSWVTGRLETFLCPNATRRISPKFSGTNPTDSTEVVSGTR